MTDQIFDEGLEFLGVEMSRERTRKDGA